MNQIIMILLISILILVHEAGHFIAARLCGVRVTRFGFGMPVGPEWKLFKWKNTNFYIHAFLFGGYVAFPDDMDNFKKDDKDEKIDEDEVLPSDSPELYENKTILQKLFIVSAGVIMNIIFAIFLVMFCAAVFKQLPTSMQELYINKVVNTQDLKHQTEIENYEFIKQNKIFSNIQEKGLKKDDKILKINGQNIESLYQLRFFSNNSKLFDNYAQEDLINQNLEELKKLNPNIKDTIAKDTKIILPNIKPEKKLNVSSKTLKGLEKYKADGTKLSPEQIELRNEIFAKKTFTTNSETNINDIAAALSDTYKPITMTISRNNNEINLDDVIVYNESGQFGIELKVADIFMETTTPKSIIVNSIKYCYNTTKLMLEGLWQLIVGKISADEMHGIIAVIKIGGDIIASKGILNGLLLCAMISLNLAIMNFLPIPALDGGHVMFLVIEQITGKKPSKELSDKITNFFFALLIILMIAICYNDIVALVTKKF